jgi:hypothetical protein
MTARPITEIDDSLDGKALTAITDSLREAVKDTKLAYQFAPNSYTWSAMCKCLAAGRAFDQHVERLAFRLSAEWLRTFPKIVGDGDE